MLEPQIVITRRLFYFHSKSFICGFKANVSPHILQNYTCRSLTKAAVTYSSVSYNRAAPNKRATKLALVNQVNQLTHQVDDFTTDQLMTNSYCI